MKRVVSVPKISPSCNGNSAGSEEPMELLMTLLRILDDDRSDYQDERLRETLEPHLFKQYTSILQAKSTVESDAKVDAFNLLLQDRIGFLRTQTPELPLAVASSLRAEFTAKQSTNDRYAVKLYSDGLIVYFSEIIEPPLLYFQELDLSSAQGFGGGTVMPFNSCSCGTSFMLVDSIIDAKQLRTKMKEAMREEIANREAFVESREEAWLRREYDQENDEGQVD